MVSLQDGVYMFTGTTKNEDVAEAIRTELENNEDMTEAALVRDAVKEHLGVE